MEIKPGVNDAQVFTLENAEPGRWVIQLDVEDALDKDNLARLAVERPRPVRVAVESDDRFFLENSVVAFSRGAGLLSLTDKNPQIVLAKSTVPDAERSLVFLPQGDSTWWSNLGEPIDSPAPRLLGPIIYENNGLRLQGHQFLVAYIQGGQRFKQWTVVVPRPAGTVVHVWSYTAPDGLFPVFRPVAEAMRKTWAIHVRGERGRSPFRL